MRIRTFAIAAGVLALALAAWNIPGRAQGPLWDRVNVNLPYSVTLGDKTLQPGEYVIQQLSSNSGSGRVLLIYSDQGMKFETSAMTIPAVDQKTPEDTKVILHHFGKDYYLDKVWIQGKDYGYEFPLPDSVKARELERSQPVSVGATYQTVPAGETAAAGASQATAAADQAPATPPADIPAATTEAATKPSTAAQDIVPPAATAPPTPTPSTAAQDTVTAPPTPAEPLTAPNPVPSQDMRGSADRSMPDTSAGWLLMLLGGGALSGAGMAIRRKR